MIVFGLVVLALAGVMLGRFLTQRRRLRATQTAETLSCDDLGELAGAGRQEAGGMGFVRVCEVVGEATPSEAGPLTAVESRQECVWHRVVITEHYWERQGAGSRRTTRRARRQIVSQASDAPFLIDDDTGTIAIEPRGAEMDGAEKVVDRREDNLQSGAQLMWLAQPVFTAGPRTIGVQHEEWILRPGARLYVLGEARQDGSRLQMRKPADGPMIVSTRSERDYAAATARSARWSLVATIGLGIVGVGLVVLSFVV